MRTRLILATLFIAVAIANYLPFTQSAYWSNAGTFFNQNTTYLIGQTNSPDNSSDYQLTSSTLPTCVVGGPWYEQYWEMDHHLLRATSADGQSILYPTSSTKTGLWMLEGFAQP